MTKEDMVISMTFVVIILVYTIVTVVVYYFKKNKISETTKG